MAAEQRVAAMDARPAGDERARQNARVDWGQVRAINNLTLKQAFRPKTLATGKQTNPLRQIITVMLILSSSFSLGARSAADSETFLILLFSTVFGIIALNILPDALESRQRQVETLIPKPISPRTLTAARTINLLLITGLLSGLFSIIPLASAVLSSRISFKVAPLVLIELFAGSFAVSELWLVVLMLASKWFSLERLRLLAQIAMMFFTLMIVGLSLRSVLRGSNATTVAAPFSLAGR